MSQCKDCRYLVLRGIELPDYPWCQYHHSETTFGFSCDDFMP
ncbi:unnamed protein product, partial [marine sediment metagenome]